MTNGQRQKIKMLRYQGIGYGKIAKATGLLSPYWLCGHKLGQKKRMNGRIYDYNISRAQLRKAMGIQNRD